MTRYPRTILATCCVPWNDDGAVVEDVFRASIRQQIKAGFRDLYVFGTAGEGYAVSEQQFDEVVRIFVDETLPHALSPMVGIISLSLSTIIERIERSAARGVNAFQISLPSWGTLSDHEVTTFFAETCGRFPHYSFLHYNLSRTKRLITPPEYASLAADYPNLVATKNSAADLSTIGGLFSHAGHPRHYFTELGYGYASMLGEPGLLVSLAVMSELRAREYFQAGIDRDFDTITTMGREMEEIRAVLKRTIGSGRIDGAYDKVFSKLLDPRFPLRLLPPYQGASDRDFETFRAELRATFPHWIEPGSVTG